MFSRIRFTLIIRVVLSICLLCGLMLGCSESTETEDKDYDISFQQLPLVDEHGNLIPDEEIPVISAEKTREDDTHFWWQLKADPIPTREDLVVLVEIDESLLRLVIRKNENSSKEYQSLRPRGDWSFGKYDSHISQAFIGAVNGTLMHIWRAPVLTGVWVIEKKDDGWHYTPLDEVPRVLYLSAEDTYARRYPALPAEDSVRYAYRWSWVEEVAPVDIDVLPLRDLLLKIRDELEAAGFEEDAWNKGLNRFVNRPPLKTDDEYVIPSDFVFSPYFTGSDLYVHSDPGKPDLPPEIDKEKTPIEYETIDEVFFLEAIPASGGELEENGSITIKFYNTPGEVTVSAGTVTTSGKTRTISAPADGFPIGSLTIIVQWENGGYKLLRYTVVDKTAPYVTASSPENGAEGVDPAKLFEDGIEVTFSEPVIGDLMLMDGDFDVGWWSRTNSNKITLTGIAGRELSNETEYTIAGTVRDGAGNEAEVEHTFVTKAKE